MFQQTDYFPDGISSEPYKCPRCGQDCLLAYRTSLFYHHIFSCYNATCSFLGNIVSIHAEHEHIPYKHALLECREQDKSLVGEGLLLKKQQELHLVVQQGVQLLQQNKEQAKVILRDWGCKLQFEDRLERLFILAPVDRKPMARTTIRHLGFRKGLMLCLPFYLLPKLITSFYCIANKRSTWYHVNLPGMVSIYEGGRLVLDPSDLPLIAFSDIRRGLMLASRFIGQRHGEKCRIALFNPLHSIDCWDLLPNSKITLVFDDIPPILNIVRQETKLRYCYTNPEHLEDMLGSLDIKTDLESLEDEACDFSNLVCRLAELNHPKLGELQLDTSSVNRIRKVASRDQMVVLKQLLPDFFGPNRLLLGNSIYSRLPEGGLLKRRLGKHNIQQIAEADLRIQRYLCTQTDVHIDGFLRYRDHSLPVMAKRSVVEKGHWLNQFTLRHGMTPPVVTLTKSLWFNICEALSQAPPVQAYEHPGYQAETHEYVLANLVIGAGRPWNEKNLLVRDQDRPKLDRTNRLDRMVKIMNGGHGRRYWAALTALLSAAASICTGHGSFAGFIGEGDTLETIQRLFARPLDIHDQPSNYLHIADQLEPQALLPMTMLQAHYASLSGDGHYAFCPRLRKVTETSFVPDLFCRVMAELLEQTRGKALTGCVCSSILQHIVDIAERFGYRTVPILESMDWLVCKSFVDLDDPILRLSQGVRFLALVCMLEEYHTASDLIVLQDDTVVIDLIKALRVAKRHAGKLQKNKVDPEAIVESLRLHDLYIGGAEDNIKIQRSKWDQVQAGWRQRCARWLKLRLKRVYIDGPK